MICAPRQVLCLPHCVAIVFLFTISSVANTYQDELITTDGCVGLRSLCVFMHHWMMYACLCCALLARFVGVFVRYFLFVYVPSAPHTHHHTYLCIWSMVSLHTHMYRYFCSYIHTYIADVSKDGNHRCSIT